MEIFVIEGIKLQRQARTEITWKSTLVLLQKKILNGREEDESFADNDPLFTLGYLSVCGKGTRKGKKKISKDKLRA